MRCDEGSGVDECIRITQSIEKVSKQDLLDRLLVAVLSNDPLIANQTPEHVENMAGPKFASTAHWSMLEPDDEVIGEDDLQDRDGHQFLPPISGLPANEDTNQRAPKKN